MDEPGEAFEEGLAAYVAGDWTRAVARLEAAHADHPEHGPTLEFLGLALMRAGELGRAVELLARAEATDPRPEVAFSRGVVEREAGRAEAALAAFARAGAAGHDPVAVRVARGSCLSLLGQARAAREVLEPDADPGAGVPDALYWYAHAAAADRQLPGLRDRALASLRALLARGEDEVGRSLAARAHFLLASLLDDREELFEEAAEHYREGLELDPGFAIGHNNLGAVYLRLGRPREARRHLLRALELEPRYQQVHRNLARLYYADMGEGSLRSDVHELVGALAPDDLAGAVVGLMLAIADEARREAYQESYDRCHRLKNLLAVAGGRLRRMVRKAEDAPEVQRGLEALQAQQEATYARLADDLRLMKPPSGEVAAVQVGALCRATLRTLRPEAEGRVALRAEVAPDLPDLYADPEELREVLDNLVRNAVEAIEGEGEVVVRAALDPEGRWLVLEVEDDGPGIDPALREGVFRPGTTTKEKGSGLGLALVWRAVHELRGRVALEEGAAGGARFVLRLPVDAGASRDGRFGLSARPVSLEDAHALNVDELA